METINLIPQEERIQQTKTKVVKASTILTIILFVIVAGVSGYFFYQVQQAKGKIAGLDSSITNLRGEINKLSEIEIHARNLYKKTTVIQTLFKERTIYSKLLMALEEATPQGVTIGAFTIDKDGTLNISGTASRYNNVQDFSNSILKNKLFTAVSLESVTWDTGKEQANFFVTVNYNKELLHE